MTGHHARPEDQLHRLDPDRQAGRRGGRAPDLKRVTLELGGNDAAIVLDDADPRQIAARLFWGAFYNAGQVCCAIKRVYAPEERYEELVEALAAEIARSVKVGDGSREDTQMGPINNGPQFYWFANLVEEAISLRGAAASGGSPTWDGYFYPPTMLADAPEASRIGRPRSSSARLSRSSPTGAWMTRSSAPTGPTSASPGSVWSADPDRGAEVAAELECGTVWVNTHMANAPHQPFGGFKWSGIGVENGLWGLDEFSELQVLHRAK